MSASANEVVGFTANGIAYSVEILEGGGSAFQLLEGDAVIVEPTQDVDALLAEIVALFGGTVRSTGTFSDGVIGEGEADLFDVRVQGNDIVALGGVNVGGQYRYVVEDDAAAIEFGRVFEAVIDAFNIADFAAPFVPEPGNEADEFVIDFQDLDFGQTSYTEDGFVVSTTGAVLGQLRSATDPDLIALGVDISLPATIEQENGQAFSLEVLDIVSLEVPLILTTNKGSLVINEDVDPGTISFAGNSDFEQISFVEFSVDRLTFSANFFDDVVLSI